MNGLPMSANRAYFLFKLLIWWLLSECLQFRTFYVELVYQGTFNVSNKN